MKELVRDIYKVLALTGIFVHKVSSCMVLSKRYLIHSNSFQLKNLIIPEALYLLSVAKSDDQ